jgi:hypothetical protein
MVNRRSNNNG